jgi:hypothetical protein
MIFNSLLRGLADDVTTMVSILVDGVYRCGQVLTCFNFPTPQHGFFHFHKKVEKFFDHLLYTNGSRLRLTTNAPGFLRKGWVFFYMYIVNESRSYDDGWHGRMSMLYVAILSIDDPVG